MSLVTTIVAMVHTAWERLAWRAVGRERRRVTRQLECLLGNTLSTIVLRSALAYRLLPDAPWRAKEEVGVILQTAQRLLTDVRIVANSYRTLSLDAEVEAALSTLRSAGITARLGATRTALPPVADRVLAIALREAVTTILLHSKARSCLIDVADAGGTARLHVAHDGVQDGPGGPMGSHGMEGLGRRLEAVGGWFWAGTDQRGQSHVIAEMPFDGQTTIAPAARPGRGGSGLPVVDRWALRVALLFTLVVACAYMLVMVGHLPSAGPAAGQLIGYAICCAVILGLQTVHSAERVRRWPPRTRTLTLSAQAIATCLPLLWVGPRWSFLAGCLAGSILLMVRGPLRWVLYLAIAGGITAIALAALAVGGVIGSMVGAIVFGAGSLPALVLALGAARAPATRAAVAQERLRVAQDLHDLLGNRLSAINLKAELSYRLLPDSPDRAREALADVLACARGALADVHEAATGSCVTSLDAEGRSAVSTLSSADIDARAEISCGGMRPQVETVLAIVLREAVTNVLRHSRARHCLIEVTKHGHVARLLVANDGIEIEANEPAAAGGGTGLQNLRNRMEGIGGRLSAGRDGTGWFRVVAEVPTPRGPLDTARRSTVASDRPPTLTKTGRTAHVRKPPPQRFRLRRPGSD